MSGVNAIPSLECCQALLASPLPALPYIAIYLEQGRLSAIDLLPSAIPVMPSAAPATIETVALLEGYFRDATTVMPPLQPLHGTPFQRRVWQLLQQIPAGQSRSYGELATALGSGARAVAAACRANPLPVLIPCHRVVAASGLGGYMGKSGGVELEIKRWLLHHEGHV
ncbi:MAG: methylated-DNA--[protein]-cysteine S-methyltransferase [Gammaproteobacteria bacterium]|nr:methylated-DNA--[protein]-cysteine S-methyltransferase [Gammaproteobacteria bacterium]